MRHGNAKRDMSRLAASKRKRRARNAMRAKGFKLLQIWVHPRDRKRVQRLARKLIRERLQ